MPCAFASRPRREYCPWPRIQERPVGTRQSCFLPSRRQPGSDSSHESPSGPASEYFEGSAAAVRRNLVPAFVANQTDNVSDFQPAARYRPAAGFGNPACKWPEIPLTSLTLRLARSGPRRWWVAGDCPVVRWRFDWGDGHIRGIDLFKVRHGKVAEKLSYVKG